MWVLLQFISGSIQKNALADFLPVMKLFDLLYPEKEVHVLQEESTSLVKTLRSIWIHLWLLWLNFSSAFLFLTSTSPSRLTPSPWPAFGSTWTAKLRATTPSCRSPSHTLWSCTTSTPHTLAGYMRQNKAEKSSKCKKKFNFRDFSSQIINFWGPVGRNCHVTTAN